MSGTESLRRSMIEADALAGRWLKRAEAAERECDQLRAERDQALTLLRQVRPLLDEALDKQEGDSPYLDGGRMAVRDAAEAARLIDASHLLDDERPRGSEHLRGSRHRNA